MDIDYCDANFRRLKKEKEEKLSREQQLITVCEKYNLEKENQNLELIKYELENKEFVISKI